MDTPPPARYGPDGQGRRCLAALGRVARGSGIGEYRVEELAREAVSVRPRRHHHLLVLYLLFIYLFLLYLFVYFVLYLSFIYFF